MIHRVKVNFYQSEMPSSPRKVLEHQPMRYHTVLFALLITAGIFLLIQPVYAEEQVQQVSIYQTTFSTNPEWINNALRSNYWDPAKGVYHYKIMPSSGSYAYVDVNYDSGPFTLEYDVTLQKTEPGATFRLGFCSKEMDRNTGPMVLSEFTNGKHGKLMDLRVVTISKKLSAVVSGPYDIDDNLVSWPGKTVEFKDNTTYHVALSYDDEQEKVTMRVFEKPTGNEIWGYFIAIHEPLKNMKRIAIGSLGDYGENVPSAEGYIDNVRLYTEKKVSVTPAQTVPLATTPPVTPSKRPTTKPTTAIPILTPTPASPVSQLIPFAALGIAACALSSAISRRKQ
jgi:hypothetical protein